MLFGNFNFNAIIKIITSEEKAPLSTKSPKNKYLVYSGLPPTLNNFNRS